MSDNAALSEVYLAIHRRAEMLRQNAAGGDTRQDDTPPTATKTPATQTRSANGSLSQ